MINNNQIPEQEEHNQPYNLSNLLIIVIGLILIITAVIFYPDAQQRIEESRQIAQDPTPTKSPSPSPTPETEPTAQPDLAVPELYLHPSQFGALILSIRDGKHIHLYAYQPFLEEWSGQGFSATPLTQLTSGPYQDITPAVSPDGTAIAFASNRNGPWDIYILDLTNGEIIQFTDTYAFDSNPTWSPDGKWLAYESYQINNLEILIQDIDQNGSIPLTNHPGADYAPSWSPQGRLISFISTRNGQQEIWYADLDSNQTDKTSKAANYPAESIKHPTWSPDGRYLSWAVISDKGNHTLVSWDTQEPERDPIISGAGDWPAWSGDGELLFTIIDNPFEDYLAAYPGPTAGKEISLPAIKMPGDVNGISWTSGGFPLLEIDDPGNFPRPLWEPVAGTVEELTSERKELIQLRNLNAPIPRFQEDAIGTFSALRLAVKDATGWDFLSTLENAFVPLDQFLAPGVSLEWLYTGRGMAINDIPRQAQWLLLVREEYRDQTYWRIFLRANNQSGILGKPMHEYAWSLDARYTGNNSTYENGGALEGKIREGYWIDFTELATAYGWMRFPAEPAWQFSETATRYQYFAFKQGLDLRTALRQLYSLAEIQDIEITTNP